MLLRFSLYNDCRSLLLEAERLLPPLTERLPENLPEAVLLRWVARPAVCPMPEDAPDKSSPPRQLLRLKAKVNGQTATAHGGADYPRPFGHNINTLKN